MPPSLLKQPLKLALIQLATGPNKAHNLSHARSKINEAARAGANLIVLPECFNSPYGTQYFPQYAEVLSSSSSSSTQTSKPTPSPAASRSSPTIELAKAQPPSEEQSPSYHMLSRAAAETKTYLLGGSVPEFVPATKKYHNTSLLFSPTGDLLATHRKVHLFDIDIPGKISFHESEVLSPGNKVTLVDIPPYGKIGVAICYDVRFPELATVAARHGAFLLLYPGAFNTTTGPLHWELQARARAVDNQIYVGMCSPARDMEASYHAWGHSMLVDPNAEVVSEAGEKEEIVYAELKGERIEEVRKGIPMEGQRRFDVYPDVSKGDIRWKE